MRTLFWKIFAWFGVAQLLIVIALYLLAAATQRGFDQGMARAVGGSLAYRTRAAAVAYEAGGLQSLRAAWRLTSRRGRFNRGGRNRNSGDNNGDDGGPAPSGFDPASGVPIDGAGGPPPADGQNQPPPSDGQDQPMPPPGPPQGDSPDGPEDRHGASFFVWKGKAPQLLAGPSLPKAVMDRVKIAFAVGGAVYDSTDDDDSGSYLARRVQTSSGARYVGVEQMNFHGRAFGPLYEFISPSPVTIARFGIVGLLMMSFCFGLARYLSAPARKLRTATRQFAAGDLTTRVGPLMGRRRDELADLGRDFDAMAVRIEELVNGQSRLLGDISHELRTPLARINVAVELALDTAEGETCDYIDRIKEESAELDALIGQLLTLQRLESRASVLKMPLDLSELVTSIAQDVDFEARSRGTRVEVMHLDHCDLEGNVELLKSAIQNITRNAVLYAGGSQVELVLEREVTSAVISVRDFGPGVPEEALERLFDPFYRVDSDRARQSGGTGLGMSITKRAIEAHGGTVTAQNAVGGGLLVQMRLPLEVAPSALQEATSHPALLQSSG